MYSSWNSTQRAASSRGIAWFWPSGSSVTMYVERFERDTTSVCTLRLPYSVGRAFGISAAKDFSSSALGFSWILAASGGLNSILATTGALYPRGFGAHPLGDPVRGAHADRSRRRAGGRARARERARRRLVRGRLPRPGDLSRRAAPGALRGPGPDRVPVR